MGTLKVNQIVPLDNPNLVIDSGLNITGTLRATNLILISGATNSPIDVIYSTFYNNLINSNLIVGATYRITDYKSVNFLNGHIIAQQNPVPTNPNFKPREIYTSITESLMVKAISNNEIEPITYSENFPEDIIEYIPYSNTINIPLLLYSGATLPNFYVITDFDLEWDSNLNKVYFNMPPNYPALFGAKFTIYAEFNDGISDYFINGVTNILSPFITNFSNSPVVGELMDLGRISVLDNQTKIIFLDLTYQNYSDYKKGTLFVVSNKSLGEAYGKIIRRRDTKNNIDVPFDFRNQKYRRFEVDLTSINASLGLGFYGIGDKISFKNVYYSTTGNYKDFFVFNGVTNNITWKSDIYDSNNVFLGDVTYCTIDNDVYSNTFGNNFNSNSIISCGDNIIGSMFVKNKIYSFFENLIGDHFINNTINGYFHRNSIGSGFGQGDGTNIISNNFRDNIIGNDFGANYGTNTISANFINNTIGDGFGSYSTMNYIATDFQDNIIGDNFGGGTSLYVGCGVRIEATSVIGLDFTLATHVYQPYNSRIFRGSDKNLYLEYFDGTLMRYVSPTS